MKISICLALVLLGLCALAAAQKKVQQSKEYQIPSFTGGHKGIRPTLYEDYDDVLSTIPELEPEEDVEEELQKLHKEVPEQEQQEDLEGPYTGEDIEQQQEYELSHKQVGLPCGRFFCGLEEDCCHDIVFNKQPVCYNLATHRCVNNMALCGINDRFCNDTLISGKPLCYNPRTHKCIRGIALCGIDESLCGRMCYKPSNLWICSGGQLVRAEQAEAKVAKVSKLKERADDVGHKKVSYSKSPEKKLGTSGVQAPKKQSAAPAQIVSTLPAEPLKPKKEKELQQKPAVVEQQEVVQGQSQYQCVGCGIHELCCLDNSVVGKPVCYSPGTHHCLEVGEVKALCAIEDQLCGRICFSPSLHKCENGVLVPIKIISHQKQKERSLLESVFSWWK